MTGAARARDHLVAIAGAPRPAGGAAEAAARVYCARVLGDAGFDVREEPFEYSAFPGRYATAAGGLLSTLLLAGASVVARGGRAGVALALLVGGGTVLGAVALWAARVGVVSAPVMRRRGLNLVATRGAGAPSLWLVAHLDSKSQPIPILVRAGAIAIHGATWLAALLLAAGDLLGASATTAWSAIAAVGVASGLPIMASVVGARSAGAVDNASGVATVLLAATQIPEDRPTGVLLTSAEELGLAGARAWVRAQPPAVALNCDGVDDVGGLRCMYSGRRPARLAAAFERAARAAGTRIQVARLLPGVLVDGVALADAGWEVLTLSRGSMGTLARIHTPRDNLELLNGSGVDDAATVLARVTRELC